MRVIPILIAGALVFGTSAFAQTHSFGSTAPTTDQFAAKKKKKKHSQMSPGSGAETGGVNSTGNMNTKGAGKGTTGTGGPGGSGNK